MRSRNGQQQQPVVCEAEAAVATAAQRPLGKAEGPTPWARRTEGLRAPHARTSVRERPPDPGRVWRTLTDPPPV